MNNFYVSNRDIFEREKQSVLIVQKWFFNINLGIFFQHTVQMIHALIERTAKSKSTALPVCVNLVSLAQRVKQVRTNIISTDKQTQSVNNNKTQLRWNICWGRETYYDLLVIFRLWLMTGSDLMQGGKTMLNVHNDICNTACIVLW